MNELDEYLKKCNKRTIQQVAEASMILSNIQWKSVSFIIDTVPVPSHRPRLCGYRVYVPGAAKNQAFFNKKVLPKLNGLFIDTPCKMYVDIYCKIPSSFSKAQTALAEMKLLRPCVNTGDNDNYEKAVWDMLQPNEKRGHVSIMANDCLIIDNFASKYYSLHPRYEVTIEYMTGISDDIRKLLRLKNVEDLI